MAVADRHGLPVSVCVESATPHEVKLATSTLVQTIVPEAPENLIGDTAYDSDKLDAELRQYGIELIAPHRIRNVMRVVFNCAMRWGIVDLGANPLTLVRIKGISRRLSEPRILTAKEIHALIAALHTEPYRTMVVTALCTGLRCSELFALKWLDFDWEGLAMLVRRAIVHGVVGEVKTTYSQSGLPLDPALAEILFSWKRASQFQEEGDWVFASPHKAGDLPLRSTAVLEDHVKPAALSAGLGSGVGWHTFRHTYSSTLRQLGVDVKVQQELLRHADIRTTMNVYTQAVSEQKRAAHSRVVRVVLPCGENVA